VHNAQLNYFFRSANTKPSCRQDSRPYCLKADYSNKRLLLNSISICFPVIGPQAYWGDDLDLSGSRDVDSM